MKTQSFWRFYGTKRCFYDSRNRIQRYDDPAVKGGQFGSRDWRSEEESRHQAQSGGGHAGFSWSDDTSGDCRRTVKLFKGKRF